MSYLARIWSRVEIVDGDGVAIVQPTGQRLGELPRAITLAGEETYANRLVVADNYTRVVVWQDGDGGVADFDLLIVLSDVNVLLELTIDRAGTPLYAVVEVKANIPYLLSSDDMVAAVLTNGSATTMDQIDQIAIKNNVADDAGDANVTIILAT